jgi:ADP-ribose pyrophosphatase YjhB (NUDIX family)
MSRKIFNFDNLSESKIISSLGSPPKKNLFAKTISAGGCLFYRINQETKKLQLLLISYSDPKWPRLDDIGGRVDLEDETIWDAIKREVKEETNQVMDDSVIGEIIKEENSQAFYNPGSKYFGLVVCVNDDFFPDTSVFGTFENADRIHRTIKWYDYTEIKQNLAYRILFNNELIAFLDEKTL